MKRTVLLGLVLMLLAVSAPAQRNWKLRRWDVQGGLGTAHFFGDLGGGKGEAARFFGLKDMDLKATKPLFHVAARYRALKFMSVKSMFSVGMISADDALSAEIGRRYRNLNFRSPIYEFGFQTEFYFIQEKVVSRYAIAKGSLLNLINAYAFLGVAGIHFNPKGFYDGNWYELQPLGTEGQGTEGRPAKYSLFELSFPLGLGAKYTLTSNLSIGLEIGVRYTTSDYIDDVSGSYFNYYEYFKEQTGESYFEVGTKERLIIDLSDRHRDWETGDVKRPEDKYPTGYPLRGNDDFNDAYLFTIVFVNYKLPRKFLGRGGFKLFRPRSKF